MMAIGLAMVMVGYALVFWGYHHFVGNRFGLLEVLGFRGTKAGPKVQIG